MPKAEKKAKADKPKKDPNAPKRPAGAYIHFCNAARESVKKENPDFGATDIVKALGAKWKAMNDDDKKKYQALADKDKERYQKDLAKYEGSKKASSE